MGRYIIAAGLAASEVGGLMMIFGVIGLAAGRKSWAILVDVLLLAGLAAWLWWRRSLVAAGLTLAFVAYEYGYLAYVSGGSNSWLTTYLVLFVVALAAHARKPKPTGAVPTGSRP